MYRQNMFVEWRRWLVACARKAGPLLLHWRYRRTPSSNTFYSSNRLLLVLLVSLLGLAVHLGLQPAIAQAQDQTQAPAQGITATTVLTTTGPTTTSGVLAIPELRRVKISFFLNSITNIDSKNGTYDVDCYLDLYWFEPALEGKQLADLDPETLWNPILEPINSQDYEIQVIGYANSLEPRTNLRLSYRLLGTFFNRFELARFPFDQQTLTFQLESAEFDSNALLFDFMETESPTIYGDRPVVFSVPSGKYLAPDLTIAGWTLGDTQVVQQIHVLPYDKSSWAQFRVDLLVTRQWQGYLWRILFQLGLVQTLFWAVLFIDSRHLHYRLLLLFTLFMLAVIFNLVLLQNLPATVYLTLMERAMLLTYTAGALTALLTVVINLLHQSGADQLGLRINHVARISYPLILVAANGLLFWYVLG